MSGNVYKRETYLEKIRKYAESDIVGNQAFLGVKGVGKTSLFQSYFTKSKRSELAQKYKKLFVFSRLDSRKQGMDLYRFLLEQVKIGIMVIPDQDDKRTIRQEMDEINEIFETPDGRLNQYLTLIREHGYDLILIMDQFHCMPRDSEIDKEQYDVLRSYNEQKLITYWIITDTDLIETCATKQYIASFFAQKFTSKMTICPLERTERAFVAEILNNQKKAGLTEDEKNMVSDVSGGVPELMSILMDILIGLKNENKGVASRELMQAAIVHSGCTSLLEGWLSGLNRNQKKILFETASSETGIRERDLTAELSRMAELADDVGRGLLHVCKTADEKVWQISTEFLRNYILNRGEDFYGNVTEAKPEDEKEPVAESHVTNIYHIEGNYIQNQTNNVLRIENAIAGLEDLQKLMRQNPVLLDETQVRGKLSCLPFQQEAWQELDEQEQETELERYADGIFSSDILAGGRLTPEQMRTFSLTGHLLDRLFDECRTQIICGIQVYSLIQVCIQRFGMNMNESESARGILFARAFEKHLKDFAAPAYCRIPEMASWPVYPTTSPFKEYPLDKTTIGTYSSMLKSGYRIFAQVSARIPGLEDKNEIWWRNLADRLFAIGSLRNQCCHSGTTFGKEHLEALIERIFTEQSLEGILVFGEIPEAGTERSVSVNTQARAKRKESGGGKGAAALQYQMPDLSLIGKQVQFQVLSKTVRGNFKGVVNDAYEGSLPKSCCKNLDYNAVKDTVLSVVVDKIQDGKYVLRLP